VTSAQPSPAWIANKQVLITGATSGIGRAAALELASRGAQLNVIARDQAKARALADEIAQISNSTSVRFFHADLADLDEVRTVAKTIGSELGPIDILVNNAGVAARWPRVTTEGRDEMLTANYLGPFVLTHLLLDQVLAASPARIVITGSEAHRMTGPFDAERFEHLGQYSGLAAQLAYGRTKLLDILFADELAARLAGTGVTVNSFCPGLVSTGLTRDVPGADRLGRLLSATPLIRTPKQGARMLIHLAADAEVDGVTGRFWTSTPGLGLLPAVAARRHPAVAERVYRRTCDLVGIKELTA
jgi:NAD(P)-dependent dehydrogenase (short-subunit alcohol dehydrogenase family)